MKKNILLPVLATAGLLAAASAAHAQTVAYWRFESSPGFASATSGSNLVLQPAATPANQPSQISTTFGSSVPLSGASNASAASFNGTSSYFSVADESSFAVGQKMTFELFFNSGSVATANTQILASQWTGTTSPVNRSWFFGTNNGQLRFAISNDGANTATANSTFASSLANNTNYYVAVVFDGTATSANRVTFYVKDLTNNGALTSNQQSLSLTTIFNGTSTFRVGVAGTGTNGALANYFSGTMDEVRWSNTNLAADQLLVAIPEPSTFAALAGLGALGVAASRRRRRS